MEGDLEDFYWNRLKRSLIDALHTIVALYRTPLARHTTLQTGDISFTAVSESVSGLIGIIEGMPLYVGHGEAAVANPAAVEAIQAYEPPEELMLQLIERGVSYHHFVQLRDLVADWLKQGEVPGRADLDLRLRHSRNPETSVDSQREPC